MSLIGLITGRETKKNKDSTTESRILQCQITSNDDVQSAEYMQQAGVDSNPPDGARAIIIQLSPSWKIAVAVNDGITPDSSLEPGEFQIYSQDGGIRKSTITLKKDGSIDIVAAGDMNVEGNLNVTGDVVADSLVSSISLKNHTHLGNLGFDTVAPTTGTPVAAPGSLPSTNASGDIIDGGSTNLSTHTHSQANDSNGDSEANTSAPL